jgi:cytochrome P450
VTANTSKAGAKNAVRQKEMKSLCSLMSRLPTEGVVMNEAVPVHVPSALVCHVDLVNDSDVQTDPFGVIDALRKRARILWSPKLGGHWIILGADELRQAFQTPELFSNYPAGLPALNSFWPRKLIPHELDGPEHMHYRRLLSPFFTPGAIRSLADAARGRAGDLIAKFVASEEIEFVDALARPLPATVFLDLFGLPVEQEQIFSSWTSELLHSGDDDRAAAAGHSIVAYLVDLIAERQRDPREDLLSHLTTVRVDGEKLTADELLDTAFLLFIAGLDTVTSQLTAFFYHLAQHPEHQRQLRHDPTRIEAAVNELLRAYPIVPPVRTVTTDCVLGGVTFKRGDRVLLATSAASRNPAAYDDPYVVDFGRRDTYITAFGIGVHRCLGMHLARQELSIVLQLMIKRLPEFELKPGAKPRWHTAGQVWGLDQLWLRFLRG